MSNSDIGISSVLPHRISIYYFSGTGNTLLVCRAMVEAFRGVGHEVSLQRMEDVSPESVAVDERAIGLGFAVACQSTYPLVWAFAQGLPRAKDTPIFMVDTLMMYSGGVVGPMRACVEAKGYRPIGACEIAMPNNLYPRHVDRIKTDAIVKRGATRARQYATDLMAGRARWGHIPVIPDLLCAAMMAPWMWKIVAAIGRRLAVDKGHCTRCGLCEQLCPVGNIELAPGPQFGNACQQCMRCLSFCPTQAIRLPWFKHATYRGVTAREIGGTSPQVADH